MMVDGSFVSISIVIIVFVKLAACCVSGHRLHAGDNSDGSSGCYLTCDASSASVTSWVVNSNSVVTAITSGATQGLRSSKLTRNVNILYYHVSGLGRQLSRPHGTKQKRVMKKRN